ncbi:MAG TPA: FoF1 ATP synthase subunit gamma [Candidatus Acidoferrum sp.]|nr:FoF1 ATP synthase subunit gamma [Candidatus Acidoferrum sp.]
MRRALGIKGELSQTHVIEGLTDIFENIASMHIAKIHDRVVASKTFFAQLWTTYQELRINPKDHFTRERNKPGGRSVLLAITTEGKLSGGSDEQIINDLLAAYTNPGKTDIMVIGGNGVSLLNGRQVKVVQTFRMPEHDSNFSVTDITDALVDYNQITVFYQTYNSLRVQEVARIDLNSAVQELSESVTERGKVVSTRDYIFEPSIQKITDYMESVMFGVALIQVIMESKLAQYAARFNSMSRAKQRASELSHDYKLEYNHAKRNEADERLKEIVRSMRASRSRDVSL